jgi:hypothetical protein
MGPENDSTDGESDIGVDTPERPREPAEGDRSDDLPPGADTAPER